MLGGFQLALAFKDLCNGIAEVRGGRRPSWVGCVGLVGRSVGAPHRTQSIHRRDAAVAASIPVAVSAAMADGRVDAAIAGQGGDRGDGRGARGDGGGHGQPARRHHARRRPPRQELPLQVSTRSPNSIEAAVRSANLISFHTCVLNF